MIIAIDPDLRKPGVCIADDSGELIKLKSMSFMSLLDLIQRNKNANYVVEDVNQIKTIYQANRRKPPHVVAKIAQDVGMVKASGTIIFELIHGITGRKPHLAPVGIGKRTKKDANLFKKITGWQGQTNEDTRDAAMIALWFSAQLVGSHKAK